MQLEALKTFCDVVRTRSFSQGAAENRVTQSSASQTIQQLEERLGARLIDRSHRPWRLTPEGQTYYDGCRELVERYLALEAQIMGVHREVASVVRVAAIYSVGLGSMSRNIRAFAERYPRAHVHMDYQLPDRVVASVLNDEVDMGIVSFPRPRRDLAAIPWRSEPMVLACPPRHPLARARHVSLSQIAGEPFVGFDRGLVIRREIDRFLKRHGVDANVALEFDNIEAIKRAVEVASGISILPRPTLDREVATGTLAAVPFSGARLVRPLGFIYRRGHPLSENAARFIELLRAEGATAPDGKKKPAPRRELALSRRS